MPLVRLAGTTRSVDTVRSTPDLARNPLPARHTWRPCRTRRRLTAAYAGAATLTPAAAALGGGGLPILLLIAMAAIGLVAIAVFATLETQVAVAEHTYLIPPNPRSGEPGAYFPAN